MSSMETWRRYRHPHVYRTEPARSKGIHWHLSRTSLTILAGLFCLSGVVWLLFGSSIFIITTVRSEGEVTPDAQTALEGLIGQRIFFITHRAVEERVRTVDMSLESVRLAKGIPNQLNVYLTRRHPVLIWQADQTNWAIDPGGVVFPIDPTTTANIPMVIDQRRQTVTVGSQLLDPRFVVFAQSGFRELPQAIGGSLQYAEVGETTFHLRFVTEWGWSIIFDTRRPLAGQLNNLTQILKDHREAIHEYVDLRLAGTAYIK